MSVPLNVYEITYPGVIDEYETFSVIRSGVTLGKAKYAEYLEYSDACPDTTYIEFLKMIRCRKVGQSIPVPGEEAFPAQDRIDIVNELIREIGSRSHRALYYSKTDQYATFHWAGGRLWFTDQYTDMPMIMAPGDCGKSHEQNHRFSSGGTMWGLVNDFKDFIYGDDDANHNNGYGGLYCTHWGYPEEDMEAVRQKAIELGYLKPRKAATA